MAPPSLRALFAYASNFVAQVPFLSSFASLGIELYTPLSAAPSCPLDGPLSCHNSTPAGGDSCCFVHPGGKVLLTQFWDRDAHVEGAEEDWTLHGLWPDHCDGTYDAYCSSEHAPPRFNNITALLAHHGQDDLLFFMNRYWPSASGLARSRSRSRSRGSSTSSSRSNGDHHHNPHESLWAHEYNKHGTCINTLSPRCYGDAYRPGIEAVDYFARAAALFRALDTYTALARAGIVPSADTTYPLARVREVLERFSGGRVVLRCVGGGRARDSDEEGADNGPDVLHEAWYVYYVQGSLQSGEFVPAQELGKEGDAANCASSVRYLPKRPKEAREL